MLAVLARFSPPKQIGPPFHFLGGTYPISEPKLTTEKEVKMRGASGPEALSPIPCTSPARSDREKRGAEREGERGGLEPVLSQGIHVASQSRHNNNTKCCRAEADRRALANPAERVNTSTTLLVLGQYHQLTCWRARLRKPKPKTLPTNFDRKYPDKYGG